MSEYTYYSDPLRKLTLYQGITTADGAGDGSTLVCSDLASRDEDFDGNHVIVTSGTYRNARDINGTTLAGTVTFVSALEGQILKGTTFMIMGMRTTPAEVIDAAALQADVTTLLNRLTALRAGYLDELDFDLDARLGSPAGLSISADLLSNYNLLTNGTYGLSALETLVDELESLLKNVTYGLSALQMEIDANETKIDTVDGVVDTIQIETDKIPGAEYTGTVSAGTAVKTLIKEITTTKRIEIKSIWLDLTLLVTGGATIELEHKIDGSTYRVFETDTWALTDDDGVLITGFTINNDFKISITGAEAAGVNIPYNIIIQTMES